MFCLLPNFLLLLSYKFCWLVVRVASLPHNIYYLCYRMIYQSCNPIIIYKREKATFVDYSIFCGFLFGIMLIWQAKRSNYWEWHAISIYLVQLLPWSSYNILGRADREKHLGANTLPCSTLLVIIWISSVLCWDSCVNWDILQLSQLVFHCSALTFIRWVAISAWWIPYSFVMSTAHIYLFSTVWSYMVKTTWYQFPFLFLMSYSFTFKLVMLAVVFSTGQN